MTGHHDPLDDLASAFLDGEGRPPESPDDELLTRIEQLEAARIALRGADAPIDPLRRDEAIEAALAAFDDELAPVAHVVVPARSRFRTPRRAVTLAAIAAAIALLALAAPLLGRLGSPKDEVVAPTNETTAGAGSDKSSPSDMMVAGADSTAADLGTFADVDALTAAVRARLEGLPTTSSAAAAGGAATAAPDAASTAPACDDERSAGGPEVFAAPATLDGRTVIVVVHEGPTGRTLVVLASDDCTTLSSRRF